MEIKISNKTIIKPLIFIVVIFISSIIGFFFGQLLPATNRDLISPFVTLQESISFPLLSYSIPNLKSRDYQPGKLVIEDLISEEENYDSYIFSFMTLGKKMTGQINIPDNITQSPIQKHSAIIMIRGYVPEEIYETGVGTKSGAAVLANDGYITIAPDFFGYGGSDPESEDTWQTRFEKPIVIVELIKTLETNGFPENIYSNKSLRVDNIGIWAHSNGGQIALATLEILDQEIPTTLWAPVTAPFPYSILYFGDELEDEGKSQRKWISLFEEKYDAYDFSLTKHLDLLQGPIQIHHGDADDAALIYWSEEFVDKIDLENARRAEALEAYNASASADLEATSAAKIKEKNEMENSLKNIDLTFHKYPGANHNMVPSWNKVMGRDVQFFDIHFGY